MIQRDFWQIIKVACDNISYWVYQFSLLLCYWGIIRHATDDSKKTRLRHHSPSGFDEDFVNEVKEDFHCLIPHLPCKDPV